MQTTQGSMLQSLRAVQAFLDENTAKLPGIDDTGARKQLDALVADLSGHASAQVGSNLAAQGATQKHQSLRNALIRDHMAPIARVARANFPPTAPEVIPLKMPRGRQTTPKLAELAYGMGQAALPFTSLFTGAGLPADFIAQLDAASDAMLDAVKAQMANRGKRGGATKGLKAKLSDGRKIVHVLDAFVRTALKDDSALLANWNIVKRVQRTGGGGSSSTPAAPPAPKPTPTTTSIPSPTPTAAPAPTAAPTVVAEPSHPAAP